MKRFALALSLVASISTLAVLLPRVHAEDGACGEKGQPRCPLQGWMEKNMQDPFDKKDLKKLAESLEKAAAFVPDPKWNSGDKGWAKIAKDGAAAAKAGDFKTVQQTCKSCHKAWRTDYKKQFRNRPISG
jgi:cytochrome c556